MTFIVGTGDVTDAACIGLDETGIAVRCDSGQIAASNKFALWNRGSGTLDYTISTNVDWMKVWPVTGTATTEADLIGITFNSASLGGGVYTGLVTVSDGGATNSPQDIRVILTVNQRPGIGLSTSAVYMACITNQTDSTTFKISNVGGGLMTYTNRKTQAWLAVTPTNGMVQTESDFVYLDFNPAGLAPGVYTDLITVTSGEATNTPQQIPVTFSVETQPNLAPVVEAGGNQTIILPASNALNATVTDDGLPGFGITVQWSKASGPGAVTFTPSATVEDPTAAFSTTGIYMLALTASDGVLSSSDTVTIAVQPQGTFFVALMNTNPAWSAAGSWAFNVPQGAGGTNQTDGGGAPDPAAGFSGTNVYGYNLAGNYAASISETYLAVTNPINCGAYSNVHLGFWRWLGVESKSWDHAYVRISTNGTTWTNMWENPSSNFSDRAWAYVEYNLSKWADRKTNLYIRWVMGSTDSADQYCGWNIDDVIVRGDPVITNAPPVVDAGTNQTITLPVSNAALNATVSDDGLPSGVTNITWSKQSGPGTVSFAPSANVEDPTATFSAAGAYTLALVVSDGALARTGTVVVTVNSPPSYTLEVATAHGTATPAPGTYTNALGTVLTNAVTSPDMQGTTQFVCAGWTMSGNDPLSGATNVLEMTVTNDAVLTWLWTTNYWLETAAGPNGSVNAGSTWQAAGVTTQIAATADVYYHFTNWSGDISADDICVNPLEMVMDAAKSVMAHFAENTATSGTPEWWLASYGWTDEFDTAESSDTDEDGMAAWQEYIAGTSPTDGQSRFEFRRDDVRAADEGCVIAWTSESNRFYGVWWKTNLADPLVQLATNLDATPPLNTYTDVVNSAETSIYYRIDVHRWPDH
ncbi:MAG: hypothetical protein BWK77_09150 [Verrucomicrobia bacterium A1]|nr:MAG: hypothetical protein BWK77_09150 [Verrucomicrobia bacterium A1]